MTATLVALTVTLSIGVTGCRTRTPVPACSSVGGSHSAASENGQQDEARVALAAAGRWVAEETVRVITQEAGIAGQGVMHAQARTGTMSLKFQKTDRMILVTVYEDDVYFSMQNVPGVSFGTSYRLPKSEVPAGSYLDVDPRDPGGMRRLIDAVVSVRRDGQGPGVVSYCPVM
ncbi:hypothetical protein ABGB16_33055 [Micromonospora sp. B11E3]|uniref:hypothetical protein n=1 Tax=Micromonospora sp. B11E3 TaxID=3153562 RepID=UPI00325D1121